MRVLILSCNAGEGHNSASKAIKDTFDEGGVYCEIVDALAFISRSSSNVISKGHVKIYRHTPSLFNHGYRFMENHPKMMGRYSGVNLFLKAGSRKMKKYITEGNFDTVICTHPFCGMMITNVKRRYGLNLKTCIVGTDYTCSPGSTQNTVDYYFIPDETLIEDFASKGAPREKIVVSGIPVRGIFKKSVAKAEAKKALGIPEDMPHLVMMCGSMGCGPIEEMAELICKNISTEHYLTIICGTNAKLYKSLTKNYSNVQNVAIKGYTKEVPLYMDSADIYMTKAGGISTSEALKKAVPMVFIKAVAGCEDYNVDFFVKMGAAITSDNINELVDMSLSLLSDKERLAKMREILSEKSGRDAAEIIYNTLTK